MKNFNDLNDTSKYLSHFIFKPGSMTSLLSFGLENVYIDDYTHRCKYDNCLLFLIKNNIHDKSYFDFQAKITNFHSFYDYYHIPNVKDSTHIMYVYQVPDNLLDDYNFFKDRKFENLTENFWSSLGAKVPLDFSHIQFKLEKEIYNFNVNLDLDRKSENINK
jgi:hypothetical protein